MESDCLIKSESGLSVCMVRVNVRVGLVRVRDCRSNWDCFGFIVGVARTSCFDQDVHSDEIRLILLCVTLQQIEYVIRVRRDSLDSIS